MLGSIVFYTVLLLLVAYMSHTLGRVRELSHGEYSLPDGEGVLIRERSFRVHIFYPRQFFRVLSGYRRCPDAMLLRPHFYTPTWASAMHDCHSSAGCTAVSRNRITGQTALCSGTGRRSVRVPHPASASCVCHQQHGRVHSAPS